ncbi:MAG: PHP domain-containing protein [Tissierellia bacterium]|nr:PHP domain-containing protein [Tissierellia bacterium]
MLSRPGWVDTHCHTKFSFDSQEEVENYLKLTPGPVVTTEHLDFDNPVTGRDDYPDYQAYAREWARLEKKYPGRLYKGIEVGYTPQSLGRIEAFLKDKAYDLVLLSVHQNGVYDFATDQVEGRDPYQVAGDYLDLVLEASRVFKGAQVLAHIDYGFRRIAYDRALLEHFKDHFIGILENIKAQDMALELNCRSIYQFGNLPIYDYVLDLNKQVGGDKYTLGSDAHFANYYRYEFDRALKFLEKKIGG